MKKTALTIFFLLCFAGILALLLHRHFKESGKETVYIALAGPMSGSSQEEGRAMLRGATLAYEEVKRDGKILKNKKIEIVPYDDKDSRTAAHIATEITHSDKVLLVLGHYSSSSSAVAGPIYLGNGIPAITASAAVENVNMDNDWFFRTIPTDRAMTKFVVHSMRQLLEAASTRASMIYDIHVYGTTAEIFKKEAENIFDSLKIWSFDSNSDNKENDLEKIINEIRAEEYDSIGPIFFATGSQDCARLLNGFRYPGTNYPIIGFSSLSSLAFMKQFNYSAEKEKNTVFHTDGIYAVSPFISYLADQPNARSFRERFVRMFGREPLRWAATYHDAMLVALNALEQAEIQGGNIQENRRKIKDALSRINAKDIAVKGVTGDIYFDENGNVDLPLELGVWQSNEFIPAYQQYRVSNSKSSQERDQGPEETEETKTAAPLRVVYAGVDINTVRNINLKKGVFTADFYLWFRFKGAFEDRAIKFIDALKPVTLGAPIMRETDGNGVTVHAYRIVADFKVDSSTAAYPFDRHTLPIRFRHDKETRNTMIYIPDVVGMPGSVYKRNTGENMLEKIFGWEIEEIVAKQNIETITDEHKGKKSYSRIDTKVKIYRQGRWTSSAKILLPVFLLILFGYFLFCLPPESLRPRLLTLLSLLLCMTAIRILYEYMPGQKIADYMLYLVVVLSIISALMFGGVYWAYRRSYVRTAKCILYKGAFFYLVVALAGVGFFFYSYSLQLNLSISLSALWENAAELLNLVEETTEKILH